VFNQLVRDCQVLAIAGLIAAVPLGVGGCNVTVLQPRVDAASDSGRDAARDLAVVDSVVESAADPSADGSADSARDGEAGAISDTSAIPDATPPDRASDAGADVDGSVEAPSAFDAATADGASCAACTAWGEPQALGPSPSVLVELSGLAASRAHPGVLYTHNDSGDSARFFAINQQAQVLAEIHLTGATATDWEDISVGPCPTGSCIYIGDTGDNKVDRTQYVIRRLPEPATLPSDGSVVSIDTYESFPFVYPDGSHNAETLLVHPQTGQVFIVLKETGLPAGVFEMPLPLKADVEVTLNQVATLAVPPAEGLVTDGSFHPCGNRLLIRTTNTTGLFELARAPGASLVSIFGATPVRVPVAVEPQGEAVTYAPDGWHYFTASETVSGDPVPSLSVVTCTAN
jgi:hypothetical protein